MASSLKVAGQRAKLVVGIQESAAKVFKIPSQCVSGIACFVRLRRMKDGIIPICYVHEVILMMFLPVKQ